MTQLNQQLTAKALTLDLVRNYEKQWPETRNQIHEMMRELINDLKIPILQLAKELKVDRGKVYRMYYGYDADALPQRWTEQEDAEIKANYKNMTARELALKMSRTCDGVSYRARILGIRKSPIPRQPQTDKSFPF